MAEFRPIFPAHAIERCSVTLAFNADVPDKALKRIVDRTASQLSSLGLRQGQQPIGFNVDALSGKVTPLVGTGPAMFVSADNRQQLGLMPNAIGWTSQQYIRWAGFKAQFEKVSSFAVQEYEALVSVSSVRLEYWDRFVWSGDWSDFDINQLLSGSHLIAAKGFEVSREWHSHVGWFEDLGDDRRLWNVNIDVVGVLTPPSGNSPSVGIYTMVQDQIAPGGDEGTFNNTPVATRLDTLHLELKKRLNELIRSEMSERIGLDSGG